MRGVSEREQLLRAFHDARPGITSRAFARAGSYARLAARVPQGRVLDLACGDGTLLRHIERQPGRNVVGVDLSSGELAAARAHDVVQAGADDVVQVGGVVQAGADDIASRVVQARAQELPFADAIFDAVTCHLAFMLFDDIARVVSELRRVLRPRGPFVALLGGGPPADGDDAFHHFASLVPRGTAFGDKRATTEAGWRDLFAGWSEPTFERWPLDLSGTFDEVWTFLSSSYQLAATDHDRIRDAVRAAFPGEHVPCTAVTFCATVTR